MEIKRVSSEDDIIKIIPVLLELRGQYEKQNLIDSISLQMQNGYEIAYVELANRVLSVIGFSIGYKLAWGKHIYIDDLVTSESHRSTGAGKLLIEWIKEYALENGCKQIHLDSGVQRFAAHKFYLREGFKIASHHFSYIKN